MQQGGCNLQAATIIHKQDHVTATPLVSEYDCTIDAFSYEDLVDFCIQYNIFYVEELYPYFPQEDTDDEYLQAIDNIDQVLNPEILPFVHRIRTKYLNTNITHGVIVLRPGLTVNVPGRGGIQEVLSISANDDPQTNTEQMQYKSILWYQTDDTSMNDGTILQSANRSTDPRTWRYWSTDVQHSYNGLMQRFLTGPLNQSRSCQQINGKYIKTYVYEPTRELLNGHIATAGPTIPNWNLPSGFVAAWNNSRHTHTKKIFTDGSVQTPPTHIGLQTESQLSQIGAAIVFTDSPISPIDTSTTPLLGPKQHAYCLYITGMSTEFCSFDTEIIAATVASSLPGRKVIYTDCQAIQRTVSTKLHNPFI